MRRTSANNRNLYARVGETIRTARLEQHIGQRELASACGVSASQLQHVEEGATPCPLSLLVAIADELDTSLDALVPVDINEREVA